MKKIVHVNLSKSLRGGEFQTIALIEALHKEGIEQEVVCRKNKPLSKRLAQLGYVKVHEVNGILGGHRLYAGDPSLLLLHAHDGRAVYWAWLEKLMRQTPYLITRRVINPLGSGWLTRQAYTAATARVAVSDYAATVMMSVVPDKPHVIMDACKPRVASKSSFPLSLGGNPRIGHVGVFDVRVKGQDILIEAFIQLLTTYPEARLYLIGDGEDRSLYQHKYMHEPRIVFVGSVEQVDDWLSQLDVFCFPSRMEALGSSVLEAMRSGVPVMTSNVGGLPELIGQDERGVVVKTNNPACWAQAIYSLLINQEKTQHRRGAAKSFVEQNNSPAQMAKQYLSIYQSVLGD